MLSSVSIIVVLALYFSLLIFISRLTYGNASNETFFLGKRESPWYIVAYGMVGATLSGITFLSVPGWICKSEFFYLQMVLGYIPGYLFVAYVLMPIYYRMQLYSIYEYLKSRFGYYAHKCGAGYFFISRLLGASLRLYLVALVLQSLLFNQIGVPFFITTLITIGLIWLYTYKGGIKTIIWTDTLQTTFMLLTLLICIYTIYNYLGYTSVYDSIHNNSLSVRVFLFDEFNNSNNIIRAFLSGVFIAIAMTGLDQDMMQKNLSCKNLKLAQKNMVWFSVILLIVNIFFLYLGALLYQYADVYGIASSGDNLFVDVVQYGDLGPLVFILFLLGLMSAAYSSADSALTSLTTSFCIDFLGLDSNDVKSTSFLKRKIVHLSISALLFIVILVVNYLNDNNIIATLFLVASYTYGPLLGLFLFGIFTKKRIIDFHVPFIVILSPILSYVVSVYDEYIFNGFNFGPDLIIVNGGITFLLLYLSSILFYQSNN